MGALTVALVALAGLLPDTAGSEPSEDIDLVQHKGFHVKSMVDERWATMRVGPEPEINPDNQFYLCGCLIAGFSSILAYEFAGGGEAASFQGSWPWFLTRYPDGEEEFWFSPLMSMST